MSKDYFVMLIHPSESVGFMPLVDEDEDILKFETEVEARAAAKSSTLGHKFGYKIFQWGTGDI